MLHCYPFVRHAGYLASIYPNVHVDLSLAITLVPHRGPDLVSEALELAPATKLLFATDASRLPGDVPARHAVVAGIARPRPSAALVDDDFVDEARALDWAQLILADNARRIYRYDDTRSNTDG